MTDRLGCLVYTQLGFTIRSARQRMLELNAQQQRWYRRTGALVRIDVLLPNEQGADRPPYRLVIESKGTLTGELSLSLDWKKESRSRDTHEVEYKDAKPPIDAIHALCVNPDPCLPELDAVVESPFFVRDSSSSAGSFSRRARSTHRRHDRRVSTSQSSSLTS